MKFLSFMGAVEEPRPLSVAWNLNRSRYMLPSRYVTREEAEAEISRMLDKKVPFLGIRKYPDRNAAQKAFESRMYAEGFGMVENTAGLPIEEVEKRKRGEANALGRKSV